ncbi:MAG: hypothetical protein IKC26_08935 [Clostridia bacterium]|nr:hypothetical protein [Clostridia bacterium]
MQLDERSINRLLSLSDKQLEELIRRIGKESGIDLSTFHITSTDAESIRGALRGFTPADLEKANEALNAYQSGRLGKAKKQNRP